MRLHLTTAALLVLLATPATAGVMKQTLTSIDRPAPGAVTALSGLHYGTKISVDIDSVRLELGPEAATADPLVASWVFACSNDDGNLHKVDLTVRLYDAQGTMLESARGKVMVKPAARGQEATVRTKLSAALWETVRFVQVQANFTTH